jgi:hypothetical protein
LYPQVLFIVGEFALVLFALSMKPWKGHFAAAAILGAAFLALWPLLPESARWLLVQGRSEEAKQVRGQYGAAGGAAGSPSSGRRRVAVFVCWQAASGVTGASTCTVCALFSDCAVPLGFLPTASSQVLQKLAAWNRSQMPTEPLADMSSSSGSNTANGEGGSGSSGAAQPVGLLTALKDWHVARRFFILAYTW